jgi:enediyne biosynthesis protein E4
MLSMKGRFPKYSDYAKATLEETLSPAERDSAYVAKSVTFASSYLENLGHGKFALRPLPLAAQIAPVFGMLVDDYDGDGNLDALLVGNSYANDTQTGADDASIGAVLLGDGKGGFRYLSGAASGFFVNGDAKAVADLVLDQQRSLVLVSQNDDSVRVFSSARNGSVRNMKLLPLDTYATLTFADGTSRRQELYYGSTYLSQSSRYLRLPAQVVGAVVHDSRGRSRTIPLASVASSSSPRAAANAPR